ncbi:MAG: site-specific DNA-methyltransferase, partial [Puniceicoccaceae bacterium]
MPTTVQLRTRLLKKLKELFQLDQPDLDFGFYKIMHAKAEQVERFIDNDLLKMVEEAFADASAEKTESEVEAAKRKLIEAMGEDVFDVNGEINEDAAKYPAGKTYTAALQKADGQVASLTEEGQVYDHLFRFFERYYDNGDFVSRRYYTRETDDRAAPFAVPYNGEEVKLHWANADQYYIKTAEYFNNYTFDLTQAAEFRAMNALERTAAGVPDTPVKVHFKIVDASEGEHGNVKVKDDEKRFFIIHEDEPIAFDENGELVVHFQYRADPEKGSKQEGSWRDFRNSEAVEVIRQALQAIQGENATAATCLQLFQAPAPTEKNKSRPLLAKYLNQYTARNTMDYFIHKNLGGFLRRELDFYIKNEVMRLDDLDQADAPAVESYLAKLKVLRKIAHKLIDFLAQLEDFQKKLWLKKKFVVETNYCITLDRVPEALYEEIAANDAQRKEWVKLFAIDEIEATEGDLA